MIKFDHISKIMNNFMFSNEAWKIQKNLNFLVVSSNNKDKAKDKSLITKGEHYSHNR